MPRKLSTQARCTPLPSNLGPATPFASRRAERLAGPVKNGLRQDIARSPVLEQLRRSTEHPVADVPAGILHDHGDSSLRCARKRTRINCHSPKAMDTGGSPSRHHLLTQRAAWRSAKVCTLRPGYHHPALPPGSCRRARRAVHVPRYRKAAETSDTMP